MGKTNLANYWGKALPTVGGESPYHPLVFHSLDVAACGRAYLLKNPKLLAQFAEWLDLSYGDTLSLLTFGLAIHDLGKFAENFQLKREDLVDTFSPGMRRLQDNHHHDAVSVGFWDWMIAQHRPTWMQGENHAWVQLMHASFGHHGTPPNAITNLTQAMSDETRSAAHDFCAQCADLFLTSDIQLKDTERLRLATWWFAGLAVLADWLGSNTDWFPYATSQQRTLSLKEYWNTVAQPGADVALQESGVLSVAQQAFDSVTQLLPAFKKFPLRPLQEAAAQIDIDSAPQLFILEDATGSGKTEAALILAARLMQAGMADGLYFGLPTMATADQMFDRVTKALPNWFTDPAQVSTVLAHGARDQAAPFRALLQATSNDAIKDEADTASLRTTEWLADSNKRALQAQIGVGTLDQVLFSALRVKHQSLRLLGLYGKALIVDEVHSYDPYMSEVLCTVLKAHAAAGGSAILLSATMTQALRGELINAFNSGLRLLRDDFPRKVSAPLSNDYPLLTRWSAASPKQIEQRTFAPSPISKRALMVNYVSDQDHVVAHIRSWMQAQQAIVWIRNTVKDALQAYEMLRQEFGDAVTLFHSRFALIDRQRIQHSVLHHLGEQSTHQDRAGRIFICTQVLQESLDVDADQMISDLTYIDVLLQRFGRYRRHTRNALGNRIEGSDQRGEFVATVYGPVLVDQPTANWYSAFSSGSARIYPAHGWVWRSASALKQAIELPQDFRRLVEEVYVEDGKFPSSLEKAQNEAVGKKSGDANLAAMSVIKLDQSYGGADWNKEEKIRSRLGDSVEAVLLRQQGAHWVPWASGQTKDGEDPWALSQIRFPGYWGVNVDSLPKDTAIASVLAALKEQRSALKYRLLVPLVEQPDESWIAAFDQACLSYCDRLGLGKK
jgi:CRISPR-associated endonuclease/helicase Cas3